MMRIGLVTVISLALSLVGRVVYPGIGARFIAPQTVLQAFLHFDPQNLDHNVIVRLRLPRLAAALLIGVSPGVADILLQAIIRNPLGGPYILGLGAGAALAVVVANVLRLVFSVGRPLLASTGGASLFLLTLLPSSVGRSGLTPMKVTLCNMMPSVFVPSITTAILILDKQTLLAMQTWLAGDLAGQDWAMLGTSVWFSLGRLAPALYLAPPPNMLALGGCMTQGLGVSVSRTRTFTLFAVMLLRDAVVSATSPIGLVSLLVSQIVRRLVSADLRVLLPLSACVGALLLLLADIIARVLFTPHGLATGVMTALVDASAFTTMATRVFK